MCIKIFLSFFIFIKYDFKYNFERGNVFFYKGRIFLIKYVGYD